MIVISMPSASIIPLLLLAAIEREGGIVVVDNNELHEVQQVMQRGCRALTCIIPPIDMDIPLSIGYVSDHYIPKHSGLASLKVIHKRLETQSSVRIRDGPCL